MAQKKLLSADKLLLVSHPNRLAKVPNDV